MRQTVSIEQPLGETIVVVIEETDRTTAHVQLGIRQAASVGGTVHLLALIEMKPGYTRYGFGALPSESEIEYRRRKAREMLEALTREADEYDVDVIPAIRVGMPGACIRSYVESVDADLLIVLETAPKTPLHRIWRAISARFGTKIDTRVVSVTE